MNQSWKRVIVDVLKDLGGEARLKDIYDLVNSKYPNHVTSSYKNTIRDCIERYSRDSEKFNGKEELFYSVEGLGNGIWGLLEYENSENKNHSEDDSGFPEGKKKLVQHIRRERNPRIVRIAKQRFKEQEGRLYCIACGFDFEKKYGDLGKDYIEGHHVIPVSELDDNGITKVDDIVLLCSNCHKMIHRKRPWTKREQTKNLFIR